MNLYILGEESPSHEILTAVSWFIHKSIDVDLSKVSYKNLSIDNNLFFEVVGFSNDTYDKIYYSLVSSTGNSFVSG